MLKRIKIKELSVGSIFFINGKRFKIMGKVIRDNNVLMSCYEDRLNHKRELSYLALDTEVMVNE